MDHSVPPKFLLIQARDQDDPIREQEIACFTNAASCDARSIATFDILSGVPSSEFVRGFDCVFIGGSGRYSAIGDDDWLITAMRFFEEIIGLGVPVFASCWGFQVLARALGGEVVRDRKNAELGTKKVTLTKAGETDPILKSLPNSFHAAMGHSDSVRVLPPSAELLAKSDAALQCFRIRERMVYATQFHPELVLAALLRRVRAYPEYVEAISGLPMAEFEAGCSETPEASSLIRHFLNHVLKR